MNIRRLSYVHGNDAVLDIFEAGQPWLYIIAMYKEKIVYVGETKAQTGGLIYRISNHLSGNRDSSNFLKRLYEEHAFKELPLPIAVIGFRLYMKSIDGDNVFYGENDRRACEYHLHDDLSRENWDLVSNSRRNSKIIFTEYQNISKEIVKSFNKIIDFIRETDDEKFHFFTYECGKF